MLGWLHAVLGQALMADPGQRWADMTALVDALERGRGTAAAPTEPPTAPERDATSLLLERALTQTADGLLARDRQRSRNHSRGQVAGRKGM